MNLKVKFNILTSFATGILLATTIFSLVYFNSNAGTENTVKASESEENQLSEEELKTLLEEKGYIVQKVEITDSVEAPETTSEEENVVNEEEASAEENASNEEESDQKSEQQSEEPAQSEEEPAQNEENNEEQKEEVKTVEIIVEMGMTSYDVGQQLIEAGLIDKRAIEFSLDIEDRGLQNDLRPGTYTVNSNMSYDELISTIFTK